MHSTAQGEWPSGLNNIRRVTEGNLGRERSNSEWVTSQLTSSSFGRDLKQGVPCMDAACTVGLNLLSVTRNPDKPAQNKLKNKTKLHCTVRHKLLIKLKLHQLFQLESRPSIFRDGVAFKHFVVNIICSDYTGKDLLAILKKNLDRRILHYVL